MKEDSLPTQPEVSSIDPDMPLRLKDAIKYGFPAGGMTVAGLRREIARGNLDFEVIAGKHFITLADIKRMREKSRAKAKGGVSKSYQPRPVGSSTEVRAADILRRLCKPGVRGKKRPRPPETTCKKRRA